MLYDIFALVVLFPAFIATIFLVAFNMETILYYLLRVACGILWRLKTWLLFQ
jgi:hypothetical protein